MEELDYNNEQRLLGDMWARFQVIHMSEGQKPNRQYEIDEIDIGLVKNIKYVEEINNY